MEKKRKCFVLWNSDMGFRIPEIQSKGIKYIHTAPLIRLLDTKSKVYLSHLKTIKIARKLLVYNLKLSDIPYVERVFDRFGKYALKVNTTNVEGKIRRSKIRSLKSVNLNANSYISETKYHREIETISLNTWFCSKTATLGFQKLQNKISFWKNKNHNVALATKANLLKGDSLLKAKHVLKTSFFSLIILFEGQTLPSVVLVPECLQRVLHLNCVLKDFKTLEDLGQVLVGMKELQSLHLCYKEIEFGINSADNFKETWLQNIQKCDKLTQLGLDISLKERHGKKRSFGLLLENLLIPRQVEKLYLKVFQPVLNFEDMINPQSFGNLLKTRLAQTKILCLSISTNSIQEFIFSLCQAFQGTGSLSTLELDLRNTASTEKVVLPIELFRTQQTLEDLFIRIQNAKLEKCIFSENQQQEIKIGSLERFTLCFESDSDSSVVIEEDSKNSFQAILTSKLKFLKIQKRIKLTAEQYLKFIEAIQTNERLEEINLNIEVDRFDEKILLVALEKTLISLESLIKFEVLLSCEYTGGFDLIRNRLKALMPIFSSKAKFRKLNFRFETKQNQEEFSLVKYDRYTPITFMESCIQAE